MSSHPRARRWRAVMGRGAALVVAAAAVSVSLGGVVAPAEATTTNSRLAANNAQVGDFNGDGKADVLSYRPSDSSWYMSWSGTSAWTRVNGGWFDPSRTFVGDLNGDGKDDLFFINGGPWLVSYGATSAWQQIGNANIDPARTWLADVNGDRKDDVVHLDGGDRWLVSYGGATGWNQVNGGFFDPNATWFTDINGDGKDDVFSVWHWANWSWNVSYGAATAWTGVNGGWLEPSRTLVGDLNGDGRSDILYSDQQHRWLVSYGANTAWQVVNQGAFDPSKAWLADFNGDGRDDLFTILSDGTWAVSYSGTTSWQRLNGGGLTPPPAYANPALGWEGRTWNVLEGQAGRDAAFSHPHNVSFPNGNLDVRIRRGCYPGGVAAYSRDFFAAKNNGVMLGLPPQPASGVCGSEADTMYTTARLQAQQKVSGGTGTAGMKVSYTGRIPDVATAAPGARFAVWMKNEGAYTGYCDTEGSVRGRQGELDLMEWYSRNPRYTFTSSHFSCKWKTKTHRSERLEQNVANDTTWSVERKAGAAHYERRIGAGVKSFKHDCINDALWQGLGVTNAACHDILSRQWTLIVNGFVFGRTPDHVDSTRNDGEMVQPPAWNAAFPPQRMVLTDLTVR